ncbi:MAG TPA: FlgO family outer membrane protein, partial [Geobacteraceae bacterium]
MLKRFLLLAIGMLLLLAPAPARADFKKIKIAVLDFQQNGRFDTPDVGKMVAEWFTTSLVETGRFDIIERRLLQQLIEEQKIGTSGIIDPRSASQIGKVLGVKTVVTGTVQSFEGRLEVNARLISVETGS